jgi:hypothetical protein
LVAIRSSTAIRPSTSAKPACAANADSGVTPVADRIRSAVKAP